MHQQNSLSKANQRKWTWSFWRTEATWNPIRHMWLISNELVKFWVDQISYQVLSKQIKSQLCDLKHFVIQKQEILKFYFNCLWGVLTNRPSIWRNFTCWIFRNIDIPSMKQNNAHFGLFVGFPKFGGITEICRIFLKGNETFQLFFEGVVELLIYRWGNAFSKIQYMSNLDKIVSYPPRIWLKISVEKSVETL